MRSILFDRIMKPFAILHQSVLSKSFICSLPHTRDPSNIVDISSVATTPTLVSFIKVSKDAKIRYRYNQVPHLTQDTNGKVTNSQLDTTNENQEVSPFSACDHTAHINRRVQRHSKHKIEKNIKYPQKKYRLGTWENLFTY